MAEDLRNWMADRWRPGLAFVYSVICIFDFIVVPVWIGTTRLPLVELLPMVDSMPAEAKKQVLEYAFRTHVPYTLQNAGLFHLAFGALLTGAAITKDRNSH